MGVEVPFEYRIENFMIFQLPPPPWWFVRDFLFFLADGEDERSGIFGAFFPSPRVTPLRGFGIGLPSDRHGLTPLGNTTSAPPPSPIPFGDVFFLGLGHVLRSGHALQS